MNSRARTYASRVVVPSAFYSHIKRAWAAGHDSYAIAKGLSIAEADVVRVLAKLRDDQHAA